MVTLRSCFPMLPHCLPAGNSGQQHLPDSSSPRRLCQQQLCHGAPASNNSVTAPPPATALSRRPQPAVSSRWRSATAPRPATSSRWRSATAPLPSTALPRRPCQQQTSSGGEEYSGLASNLAHLCRIC